MNFECSLQVKVEKPQNWQIFRFLKGGVRIIEFRIIDGAYIRQLITPLSEIHQLTSIGLQCFPVYPVNLDGGSKNFGRITEIDRITKTGQIKHILLLLLATVP